MSPEAVGGRLRLAASLLRERGFGTKGADMSPAAVTARLRTVAALSELCRRLAAAGALLQR